MIIIFSRPVRSGKTTDLLEFCKRADDIGGILMPDKGEEKQFYDIASQVYFEASVSAGDNKTSVITVGQFRFDRSAFEKASHILETSKAGLVIVDEAGKLELADAGFHSAMVKLISQRSANDQKDLLLVVRDYLLNEVLAKYGLQSAVVVHNLHDLNTTWHRRRVSDSH